MDGCIVIAHIKGCTDENKKKMYVKMYLFVVVIADKIAFLMNESLQLMDYLK